MNAPFFTKKKEGKFNIGYRAIIEALELPMIYSTSLHDKKIKHFPKGIGDTTLVASLFSHLHFGLKNEAFKKFFNLKLYAIKIIPITPSSTTPPAAQSSPLAHVPHSTNILYNSPLLF